LIIANWSLKSCFQVGGYWWSIKGEMLQLTQLKQQEQNRLKNIQSKVSQLANKPHLLPQFDEVSQRYAELTHQFVQENELATMLDDIGRFSQAIAALSPMINVVDVSWQRVSPTSQKLHLRARAFSYQLKSPVNDEN